MKKLDFEIGNAPIVDFWMLNKLKEICIAVDKINEKLFQKCTHSMGVHDNQAKGLLGSNDAICTKCGWVPSMEQDPNEDAL